jgi:hypothetical protein
MSLDTSERRVAPRTDTAFFAVDIRGNARYQRLVCNISSSGFRYEDRLADEKPGDQVVMDFPLPGSKENLRVRGRVVYALAERGVGVEIDDVDRAGYEALLATPPSFSGPLPIAKN